jgi:tRNA(Ile)-lysidine synthase TilS/MesJ
MRKGALVQEVLRLGCNKIAYAHHKDDFVETMLMSMIFQGQFYAFPPVTWFEDTGLKVLRPLMLVEEAQVKGFCNRYQIPVMKSPCPVDGTTKRAYAKALCAQIQREHPGAKERMFHAIVYGQISDWPKPLS